MSNDNLRIRIDFRCFGLSDVVHGCRWPHSIFFFFLTFIFRPSVCTSVICTKFCERVGLTIRDRCKTFSLCSRSFPDYPKARIGLIFVARVRNSRKYLKCYKRRSVSFLGFQLFILFLSRICFLCPLCRLPKNLLLKRRPRWFTCSLIWYSHWSDQHFTTAVLEAVRHLGVEQRSLLSS